MQQYWQHDFTYTTGSFVKASAQKIFSLHRKRVVSCGVQSRVSTDHRRAYFRKDAQQ